MSEQREITVQKNRQAWQEHDREILIELWHNPNETTTLRLSHKEAGMLLDGLADFLGTPRNTK